MTLLTVDDLRKHVTSALVDDALQMLLDAEEQAIVAVHGPIGTIVDLREGGVGLVALSRRAGSITSVDELYLLGSRTVDRDLRQLLYAEELWTYATALEPEDYLLDASGYLLQRQADGPNPADIWGQGVRVTYASFDDTAERKRVQLELMKLDLTYSPGLASQRIGDWTEAYQAGTGARASHRDERDEILLSMVHGGLGFA